MVVDLDKYRINRRFIHEWFIDNAEGDVNAAISILAQATMCPCIVVAYFLGEVTGWTPELARHIETLRKFYGYTEIRNKPEGCTI